MQRQNLARTTILGVLLAASLALLPACGGGNGDDDGFRSYRVTLVNLTASQPLSPPGVVLHEDGYVGWDLGVASGAGLEVLAESGDPAVWLAEAGSHGAVHDSAAGAGGVLPGASATMNLLGPERGALYLTLATMLVNTNDGFAGAGRLPLVNLGVGETLVRSLLPYDAGTEGNSESADTVPGPAAGGEGFNAARDDRDFVSIHPGVISADDGLVASALAEAHRFQTPVAEVQVTRLR